MLACAESIFISVNNEVDWEGLRDTGMSQHHK
jgi:hypothetical protein